LLKSFAKSLAVTLLCTALYAQTTEQSSASAAAKPESTKKDEARDARRAEDSYKRALRLQRESNLEEAVDAAIQSQELSPNQPLYATTAEFLKQQLINQHIDKGNALLISGKNEEALAEFRLALSLDPTNAFALQRMKDAGGAAVSQRLSVWSPTTDYSAPPELQPKPGRQDISVRGQSRQLFDSIGKAFSLGVIYDESFVSRQVKFDLKAADFPTAIHAAELVTKSFYMPLGPNQILVAADTQDVRRRIERMATRTFFLTDATAPQDLSDVQNMLRILFDLRFITADQSTNSIIVRAPKEALDAAAALLDDLQGGPPEVALEIHAIQVSDSFSRQIGINWPLQFTIFNVPTEAANLANQPGIGDLINRIASGGNISPQDAAAVAALLASQQSPNSPLLKGFATFGGGRTLSGITLPGVSITASENKSAARSIQKMMLRAQQGKAATFRVGDRIPVLTSLYSPLAANPLLNQAIRNNQAAQPIPSFNYEDLGITLKATPAVTRGQEVKLDLELTLKSLAGAQLNNVPVISNREFKGAVLLKDGETSIIAGSIDSSETRSVQGLPLLSKLPGIGAAFGVPQKQTTNSQLLFLVTPHVIRGKSSAGITLMMAGN
jgi:tetratricopeptide (TPR) repeat protein